MEPIKGEIQVTGDTAAIDNFGSSLKTVGEIAGGILSANIIGGLVEQMSSFVTAGLQAAQGAEIIGNTFRYQFGAGSGGLLSTIEDIAGKTPLTNEQLSGLALNLRKLPQAEIPAYLKDIADIASASGISFQDMGNKASILGQQVQTAMQYGAVSSRMLRPLLNSNVIDAQTLVDVINQTGGAFSESAQAQAKTAKETQAASEKHDALTHSIAQETEHLRLLNETQVKTSFGSHDNQLKLDRHNNSIAESKYKLSELNDELAKNEKQMETSGVKQKIATTDLLSMSKGFQISTDQLLGAIRKQAEGKDAGAAAAQAKTLAGTWQQLGKTYLDMAKEIIGINQDSTIRQGSIFDTLKNYASQFLTYLNAHKGEISQWFNVEIRHFIDYLVTHKEDLSNFFLSALTSIEKLANFISGHQKEINTLFDIADSVLKLATWGGTGGALGGAAGAAGGSLFGPAGTAIGGAAGFAYGGMWQNIFNQQKPQNQNTNITMHNTINKSEDTSSLARETAWRINGR